MAAVALAGWVILLVAVVAGRRVGRPTTVTLLQYQGGVLYDRGWPKKEVAAGRYRVWAGVEKIMIVDKRATSVSFENRAVTLSDGATAVYGFSGSAAVRNISKALYCARNYNEMPAYVLLCCTRAALNQYAGGRLLSSQEDISRKIVDQAKARLDAAGFELQTFRFTHLSIAAPAQPASD